MIWRWLWRRTVSQTGSIAAWRSVPPAGTTTRFQALTGRSPAGPISFRRMCGARRPCWRVWRHQDALESADRALAIAPATAQACLGRGNALVPLKRFDEAYAAFDRALALEAQPCGGMAGPRQCTYAALARYHDALIEYERALSLKPDLAEALIGRGGARAATGRADLSVKDACRALELGETDEARTLFTQSVRLANLTPNDGKIRELLARALTEGWTRPSDLAGACIGLIKRDARIDDCIARVNRAWPARLADENLISSAAITALSHDQLLNRVLQCVAVTDVSIERLLANLRLLMLTRAANTTGDESLLGFYCSLATQCFINEYVFSMTGPEAEEAQRLRASLEESADGWRAVPRALARRCRCIFCAPHFDQRGSVA